MTAPNILVARLSSLGDIVLTAPVYRNLKAKWPDCRITVLVKPQFAAALQSHPSIDEVLPFRGLRQTLKDIRSRNFTHFLDLHSTLRTHIIGALCGIGNKARYKKDSLARKLFVSMRISSPALDRHVLNRYLDALKQWDVPIVSDSPELADWSARPESAPRAQYGKICILQTAFLGDAVLTSPLVKKTKETFPSSTLIVVCRPETADIFRAMPEVSSVIVDNKKTLGQFASLKALANALKAEKPDLVIVPHRSLRSALAAWLCGAPERVGFSSSAGKFLLTKTIQFSWLLHDAERNLSLLNAVSTDKVKPLGASLGKADGGAQEAVKAKLRELGWTGGPLAGVHPGSVWFTKRWPADRFARLCSMMQDELGLQIALVGGKGDAELCEQVRAASGGEAINLAGKTSIPELMALMPLLKTFVTNDSGPMHIAVAFNVPTVGIFGPTTKELGFFPYGKGHIVMEAAGLTCRPCALHGGRKCPHGHFLCMLLITPESVFSAVKDRTFNT